ncbi:hypothetical protein IRZ71_17275 [Flavobacterium sp. ANB]|uniref:hypothetical protein n=1 Tax=unclassified Flavobacterium TaxID=196869 RepID=UPI0012B801CA|nr:MULTISPECIES: hypothetical protein [unclassified Flavobacterium]MBF4518120.1 hypothetical protein [Flavobacterium sp. ANB]MTD71136.1 hypothetical protein [Flavobacterium sp. LC2016-13]
MPKRFDRVWEFEKGIYIGDPISFVQNIEIKNNFEVQISKNQKSETFYVLGCYFGSLYLLEKNTFKFTQYSTL